MTTEIDDFWCARPILSHVRQFAQARRRCPWAVLGVTIIRANGIIPPAVGLPPHVGGRASLNTFVALTGPSGAGKGTSESAARDAITFRWRHGAVADLPEFPIGSGEGIARTFMPPAASKDGEPEREQIITAIFSVPEVDTAAGLFSRSGSTLESELRKVFSGEQLGFTNAQAHTRTRVPAHTYRCGLIVGVQPGRAGALLDGADGGTPQRFVWLPVLDADMPDERPDEPPPVTVDQPEFRGDLTVPDVARAAIDAHQLAMHRGTVDPLDGHRLLVRLKVAAALMVLDSRDHKPAIDDEDWHLAGTVMEVSDRTRAWVQRERSQAAQRSNRGRALATAERDEVISERKLQRAKQAIVRWLDKAGELPSADLRRRLKADLRDYYGAAIAELADENTICEIPIKNGMSYRINSEGTHVPKSTPPYPQFNQGVPHGTRVPPPPERDPNSASSHTSDPRRQDRRPKNAVGENPPNPARPEVCQRCNVSLPTAARSPFCDECTDTPERPIEPRRATEYATRVVHNGPMSTADSTYDLDFGTANRPTAPILGRREPTNVRTR
ncbi:hypothetical protein PR370_06110 [Mycobacterium marinum]|uniref:hypothetical protein n=1 Tax=Mycobacterium marinum TaxID=1781 RepID=UPI0023590815|nr:hypothetical protein [Mycobacterium marinum]MDC8982159.1 hypothetical protein [Mycobacterium marinum]MDC8998881.1 hypothetical protein [Mycobacterium marinum]MDC9009612.1 hypothetical protein [Mycobacterium marinum]